MTHTANNTDCTHCGAAIGECDGYCNALPNELDDATEMPVAAKPMTFDQYQDHHAERLQAATYLQLLSEAAKWYEIHRNENSIHGAIMVVLIQNEMQRRLPKS